jgi:predicted nucleic acid-binding protein
MKKYSPLAFLSLAIMIFSSCQMTQERIKESAQKSCKMLIEKIDDKAIQWATPSNSLKPSMPNKNSKIATEQPTNIWEAAESGRSW